MELDGKSGQQRVDSLGGANSSNVFLACGLALYPPRQTKSTCPARHEQAAADLLSLSLSSTYLVHFQKANRPAKLALVGVSLLILIVSMLGFPGALPVAGLSISFLAAVALKEGVVSYRISHGLFGSTAAEARLLLRFLIQNSSAIDFDDRNGKPRRIFEPPVQSTGRQKVPAGAITE
ncbi:hypothetical protein [Steroidobacter agaridevorans]|uniref:hypothetical protein n=1 Tax=Steroidobacter agaridevorans TaxID=2695856 RepID=UPI001F257275|nr:hypothetical protein [Steroidobacter agaridevorans]